MNGVKKCVFCDQPMTGLKSNEHIIPYWLLKYLNIKNDVISPTHHSIETGEAVSTRTHVLDKLLAGGVCRNHCNGGWMSDLEVEINDLLIELIEAKRRVDDLSHEEKLLLSRWATKTAYTLNLGSNFTKMVPLEHFHSIYKNPTSLPDNVYVFAQNHKSDSKFYWNQNNMWRFINSQGDIEKDDMRMMKENGYKIGFQFGSLLLLVVYVPIQEYALVLNKDVHIIVYPGNKRGRKLGEYDMDFTWDNSKKALIEFSFGVQLAI